MSVDEEIEMLEHVIADIESAISEIVHFEGFEDKVACWEDDLKDLTERLEELEAMQNAEWQQEMRWQNREYERGVI